VSARSIPDRTESGIPAGEARAGQPKTVEIRLRHFVILVLAVGAFGGGFALAKSRSAPAAAVPAAAGNVVEVPLDASGLQQPFVLQSSPLAEMDPGVVLPMEPPSHPLLGQAMIDIEGVDLAGQPAKLSDYAGKSVMLNFWATWCPPCRVEMPWMERVYQEFADRDFEIVAVDAGERVSNEMVTATVSSFIQGAGLTFPVLLPHDPYTPQVQYTVYGLPSTYMIDPNGIVVDVHRGMYPNHATLRDRVVKLLDAAAGG
jgi:thiol-disulfide isomerase/thioredoxin